MLCIGRFEFDGEYKSRLDFAKLTNAKVADLITMEVLLLDEALHQLFTPITPRLRISSPKINYDGGSKRIQP